MNDFYPDPMDIQADIPPHFVKEEKPTIKTEPGTKPMGFTGVTPSFGFGQLHRPPGPPSVPPVYGGPFSDPVLLDGTRDIVEIQDNAMIAAAKARRRQRNYTDVAESKEEDEVDARPVKIKREPQAAPMDEVPTYGGPFSPPDLLTGKYDVVRITDEAHIPPPRERRRREEPMAAASSAMVSYEPRLPHRVVNGKHDKYAQYKDNEEDENTKRLRMKQRPPKR